MLTHGWHHKGRTDKARIHKDGVVPAQNRSGTVRPPVRRTRARSGFAHLPRAGFRRPVAYALLETFSRAVGEAYGVRAFDHANLVNIPRSEERRGATARRS